MASSSVSPCEVGFAKHLSQTRGLLAKGILLLLSVLGAGCDLKKRIGRSHPLDAKTVTARFNPPGATHPLPYRLFVPPSIKEHAPLVVFLHGIDGCGTDNYSQLNPSIELLVSDKVQALEPTFVLVPQSPKKDPWVLRPEPPPYQPVELAKVRESESARLLVKLVADLVLRYPIDSDRVYLMGFSLGGAGTWDILMRHAGVFAAAVPITGVGDPSSAHLLKGVAIWSFHGELDEIVRAEHGRRMYDAMLMAGVNARYTEYAGVGHSSIGPALDEPGLVPWLLSQRRTSSISGQSFAREVGIRATGGNND